jgi:glutamyl endopeptidase
MTTSMFSGDAVSGGNGGGGRCRGMFIALLGAVAWLGVGQGAASAQAPRPLSSDGAGLSAPPAASGSVSPAYEGSGRLLAPAGVESRPETAAEVWRLWAARPMTAPVGVESIIGTDDRTRVNPITSDSPLQARATALIAFNTGSGLARCSGFLINKNTVVTAGHCVAAAGSGEFYNAKAYQVSPGRNGAARPFGK